MKKIVLAQGVYERRKEVIAAVRHAAKMKGWDVVLPDRDYVGMAKVVKHMPDYQQKIEEFQKLSRAMRDDAVYGLSLLEQLENDKILVIYDGGPCDLYAYANVDENLDKRWFSRFLIETSEKIGYDAVFQLLSYVNMNREDQHETISLEEIKRIETTTAELWDESKLNFTQINAGSYARNLKVLLMKLDELLS